MCTPEEVQKIVHAELLKQRSEFVTKFWYIMIGLFISTASAWYSLFFQVQNLEKTVAVNEMNTQKQLDLLRADYKSDINEIKQDIRFIRDRVSN